MRVIEKMIHSLSKFLALKATEAEVLRAEEALQAQLRKLINKIAREVATQLQEPGAIGDASRVTQAFAEARGVFATAIQEEIGKAVELPRAVIEELKEQSAASAEKTLARLRARTAEIIDKAFTDGVGVSDVQRELRGVFTGMRDSEIRRLAQNEIANVQSLRQQQNYVEADVRYQQWDALLDNDTRDSHIVVNGEIVAIGERFSNGLRFPNDRTGDIEEWINCRCDVLPFNVPFGLMVPPGMTQFRESDLIKIRKAG